MQQVLLVMRYLTEMLTNMNTLLKRYKAKDQRVFVALTLCILILVTLTLVQDHLRSNLKNSAFYFSESFLFSSFWWLFAPFLFAQYIVCKQTSCIAISCSATNNYFACWYASSCIPFFSLGSILRIL